jgi:hypothetical protein
MHTKLCTNICCIRRFLYLLTTKGDYIEDITKGMIISHTAEIKIRYEYFPHITAIAKFMIQEAQWFRHYLKQQLIAHVENTLYLADTTEIRRRLGQVSRRTHATNRHVSL